MSVWSDIHKRSNGHAQRKEDIVEENAWEYSGLMDVVKNINKFQNTTIPAELIKESMKKMMDTTIVLTKNVKELQKKLDEFKWIKK
jgi:ribose 5-phosphate isomerase